MSLLEALESVVDKYKNDKLGVPTHVTAQYLKSCFQTFEAAVTLKDAWHEGKPTIDEAAKNIYKTGSPCPKCAKPLSSGGVCMSCGFEGRPSRAG